MDKKSYTFTVRASWVRYGLIALVTTLIVAPLSAGAANRFTDVPDTNVFHDDITWLADAGVTLGCNPPTNDRFCPTNTVTRQTMAAFLKRLSVNKVVDAATAVNAEHADHATAADTATNATNADNATLLDGLTSDAYRPDGLVALGDTITGVYAVGGETGDWGHVEFGWVLPSAVTPNFIANGDPATAACPGTAADPQATAGNLCLYEQGVSGVTTSSCFVFAPGQPSNCDKTTDTGFGLWFRSTSATGYSYGSWAATAATAPAAAPASSGSAGD